MRRVLNQCVICRAKVTKMVFSSKIIAYLVDEDISMLILVFGVLHMMEEHYIVQKDLEVFPNTFHEFDWFTGAGFAIT